MLTQGEKEKNSKNKERSAEKIKLTSLEDLLSGGSGDENTDYVENKEIVKDTIIMVPITELTAFKNHPFKVRDDKKMEELVESIKEQGIINPILCRPLATGGLEIVSGHCRKHASEINGIEEIPVIVRELTDEQATIIMVDSNIQRENLSYSEKAFAYRMKMDAMNRQGIKSTSGEKINSADTVGEKTGDSKRTVFRYIRLSYLIEELLELVDNKKLAAFPTGMTLSYLSEEEQKLVYRFYSLHEILPTPDQAGALKKKHDELKKEELALTDEIVCEILKQKKEVTKKVVLKEDSIKKYFPEQTTPEEMEKTILELLEKWHTEREE